MSGDDIEKGMAVVGLVGTFVAGTYALMRWSERERAEYDRAFLAWAGQRRVDVRRRPHAGFEAEIDGRNAWLLHRPTPSRGPLRHRLGVTLRHDRELPCLRTTAGASFDHVRDDADVRIEDAELDVLLVVSGDPAIARRFFDATRRHALHVEIEALRAHGFEGLALEGRRLWAEGMGPIPIDRLDVGLGILGRLADRLEGRDERART